MPNIIKLEVSNFRNIDHATYNLPKRAAFSGKNFTGKTNSLLAIHWLLSDVLLDGSSDLQSLKPSHDTKLEVRVKATLDTGATIEKRYGEDWVKTRGADTVTLQGHYTTYFINETKMPSVSSALSLIKEILGLDKYTTKSKIEPLRMLINPLYLPLQVEWKNLRNYIIELVGDVKDQDVYAANPMTSIIQPEMMKNGGRTDMVMKFYKQSASTASGEITRKDNLILDLQEIKDIEPSELLDAQDKVKFCESKIAELQQSKLTKVNPRIAEIEKTGVALAEEKNRSLEKDRSDYDAAKKAVYDQVAILQNKQTQLYAEISKGQSAVSKLQQEKNQSQLRMQQSNDQIAANKTKMQKIKVEFDKLATATFAEWLLPTESKCPHCGGLLNEDAINNGRIALEKARDDFYTRNDKQLDTWESEVNQLKLDNENHEFKARNEYSTIQRLEEELCGYKWIQESQEEVGKIAEEIRTLQSSIQPFTNSELTNSLNAKLVSLREQLVAEKTKNFTSDIDEQIRDVRTMKEQAEKVIQQHLYYLNTKENIRAKQREVADLQKQQADAEQHMIAVETFIRTKLSMLDENVNKVFGSIKFRLVENNIKEGSYNEVCYPLILGKETPYEHGSTSERVITGVAIIEAIRRHAGLPELPILFDEAESLDSETLVNRLNTNCQIISTKVDDNYRQPTVVSI